MIKLIFDLGSSPAAHIQLHRHVRWWWRRGNEFGFGRVARRGDGRCTIFIAAQFAQINPQAESTQLHFGLARFAVNIQHIARKLDAADIHMIADLNRTRRLFGGRFGQRRRTRHNRRLRHPLGEAAQTLFGLFHPLAADADRTKIITQTAQFTAHFAQLVVELALIIGQLLFTALFEFV